LKRGDTELCPGLQPKRVLGQVKSVRWREESLITNERLVLSEWTSMIERKGIAISTLRTWKPVYLDVGVVESGKRILVKRTTWKKLK
jgi:hypothetical protein